MLAVTPSLLLQPRLRLSAANTYSYFAFLARVLFFVCFLHQAHARHMVGGRAPNVMNELLYRFEFPESPGALSRFLAALSGGWNVSLFHYRNHGSDFGRVLAGIQVR